MSKPALDSRHWIGKASAGLVLGFILAVGLSGLLQWAIGVGEGYFSAKGQLTMWSISPVWCGILSFVFLFRSGARAWSVLGIAALAVWSALYLLGRLG